MFPLYSKYISFLVILLNNTILKLLQQCNIMMTYIGIQYKKRKFISLFVCPFICRVCDVTHKNVALLAKNIKCKTKQQTVIEKTDRKKHVIRICSTPVNIKGCKIFFVLHGKMHLCFSSILLQKKGKICFNFSAIKCIIVVPMMQKNHFRRLSIVFFLPCLLHCFLNLKK